MSLSICLITRNEAGNLGRALKSVRGLGGQTVVVDTGSTDDTPCIAKEFGAEVYHFTWCDDFSAARNCALEQATGDWILWLDADEELLRESEPEIERWMAAGDALAVWVLRRDLSSEADPNSGTEMWQLRLFRRRPELRFRGRCHPEFHLPIVETAKRLGMRVCESQIRLRHYGYLPALRPAKLQRAARLLELELRDRPGQLYYQIELGRTLLLMGDKRGHEVMRQAAEQVAAVNDAPVAPVPLTAALLEYLLLTPGKDRAKIDAAKLAERWFPKSPPLVWVRAQALYAAGDFAAAAGLLQRLVNLRRGGDYDKWASFDPRIMGAKAELNLAACYIRLADLDKAVALLKRLCEDPEVAANARQMLDVASELKRQYSK